MSEPETFGAMLRAFRERRGWSMTMLAGRASLSGPAIISRFESDARRAWPETVARLAKAMELDDADAARLHVAAGYWPGERGAILALDALSAARAAGLGNKWE